MWWRVGLESARCGDLLNIFSFLYFLLREKKKFYFAFKNFLRINDRKKGGDGDDDKERAVGEDGCGVVNCSSQCRSVL